MKQLYFPDKIRRCPLLTYLYTEINVIGIIILLFLLNNFNKNRRKNTPIDQKIFNTIMILILLIFLFDTGMWLFDEKPKLRILNIIVTTGYYLLNPAICFVWLLYTDYKIFESKEALRRCFCFYVLPAFVCIIISLCSPFTGWFFVISKENHYIRGPYFYVFSIVSIGYLLVALMKPIKDYLTNKWKESRSVNLHLILFNVCILTATIVQTLFFGISIIWVCAMLSCVSIYINVQNHEISIDHLTGLYNRRRLDQHLQRRIKSKREDNILFAIMLDMDEFKAINDVFGHSVGDIALTQFAGVLQDSCKGIEDFIARIGGDEFVIIGERKEDKQIKELIDRINDTVLKFNQSHSLNYTLKVSMGYSIIGKKDSLDSLLIGADKEMYKNKQERKSRKYDGILENGNHQKLTV